MTPSIFLQLNYSLEVVSEWINLGGYIPFHENIQYSTAFTLLQKFFNSIKILSHLLTIFHRLLFLGMFYENYTFFHVGGGVHRAPMHSGRVP